MTTMTEHFKKMLMGQPLKPIPGVAFYNAEPHISVHVENDKATHALMRMTLTMPAAPAAPTEPVLPEWLMPEWKEQVYRALLDLPPNPGAIADYLHRSGIKGYQNRGDECPISRYITSKVTSRVGVGKDVIFHMGDPKSRGVVDVPPQVQQFIDRFDHGHYPFLEDKRPAPPMPKAWQD